MTVIHMDKQREIRFDFNALSALEKELGVDSCFEAFSKTGARTMVALAWAGMIHAEPKLSIQEAGRRLSIAVERDGMEPVVSMLMSSLQKALGISEEQVQEVNELKVAEAKN
ncbi:hypothetical protein SAMN05444487_11821 [Marininema mesophilum]|uniref:Phage tail tube protein, GTA-gp10 n=1 Tax=Marininema mesophilum TaxID=1048340 RepID=A0A1H3BSY5_9BACL|nr:hypothetical protein [Marininema mesophilum]SDX45007.1 hypothetical protein SAMN05444487_11821 [Marininema mesophilum]